MMNVQHERIIELCTELRIGAVAAQYPALAQQAAEEQSLSRTIKDVRLL
jgi:hypothetical protein